MDFLPLWPSVFIEPFNQEFHIVINLPRNGRWSQRHGAGEGGADRWDAGEVGHGDGDGDECQKGYNKSNVWVY